MINPLKEKDVVIYKLGNTFLHDILQKSDEKDAQILQKYWQPDEPATNLNQAYERLLNSVKNRNRMPSFINSIIGNIKGLESILDQFDPHRISDKYSASSDWKKLSDHIIKELGIEKKLNTTNRGLWPKFCQAAISGARFLSGFKDYREFSSWLSIFNKDETTRASLALLISCEIDGFGFALACDFIMELGHCNLSENFGKPDVHLKSIFNELKLCESKNGLRADYEVFKAIQRIAKNNNQTPYKVDRLFWLIGSGNFYLDNKPSLGRHKKEFIKYSKKQSPNLF
ncbi:MAG: hypothetical protein WC374_03900 [Phycisphaerae bacterium]|jgi:hypothetical protein